MILEINKSFTIAIYLVTGHVNTFGPLRSAGFKKNVLKLYFPKNTLGVFDGSQS